MRDVVKWVLLSEAFAVTSFGLGWWSVPIVAALYAAVAGDTNSARVASLCAAAGWLTLLLLDVARGQVGTMGAQLAGVMNMPAPLLYVLTLVFPALLAWSAATIVPRWRKPSAQTAGAPKVDT